MSAPTDYRRQIYAIRDLPTLPVIAQKILALVDDDEAGAEKLAKVISSDQSLSVKILSLANSAYYGHRAQIGTVRQAIVVIGTNMLKQISLSVLVFKGLGGGGRERVAFWRHSIMTANAASAIGKLAGIPARDVCFMGGLLHDVGKLVLDANLPKEYQQVRAAVKNTGCTFREAEQNIFQTDHVEVGAWMAERWQLPPELVLAIGRHHAVEAPAPPHARMIATVHAANICAEAVVALKTLPPAPENPMTVVIPDPIRAALNVTEKQLVDVVVDLKKSESKVNQFLGW
jgi:putative nucleotidyltransferase with HDIG domain